jgi:hypothetical protein
LTAGVVAALVAAFGGAAVALAAGRGVLVLSSVAFGGLGYGLKARSSVGLAAASVMLLFRFGDAGFSVMARLHPHVLMTRL